MGIGRKKNSYLVAGFALLVCSIASSTFIVAEAQTSLNQLDSLGNALLKVQAAWVDTKEQIAQVARSRSAPRVRRRRKAELESNLTKLEQYLKVNRARFGALAKKFVYSAKGHVGDKFQIQGDNGVLACVSSNQGGSGTCTQENTNQTFSW